jgi:ABC-2 type transport system ATP-binding protein
MQLAEARNMSDAVVQFVDICRDYSTGWLPPRSLRAVDRVSFSIDKGEVFGLLGPNRAGKTTLVKMLLTLCKPTSGDVFRFGQPVSDRTTLHRVGYMHENHAFPRYLCATELLGYYGAMSLVPFEQLGVRVQALLEWVGLVDRASDPIWTYSKGMVQRLGLAQALINEPDLLVLDEPTEGLDLSGRRLLREVIERMRSGGRTVLLVSHVLSEVEQLCSRVAVIAGGKLKHVGPVAGLKAGKSFEEALHELYNA